MSGNGVGGKTKSAKSLRKRLSLKSSMVRNKFWAGGRRLRRWPHGPNSVTLGMPDDAFLCLRIIILEMVMLEEMTSTDLLCSTTFL